MLCSYISPKESVCRRRAASIGAIPDVRGVGLDTTGDLLRYHRVLRRSPQDVAGTKYLHDWRIGSFDWFSVCL